MENEKKEPPAENNMSDSSSIEMNKDLQDWLEEHGVEIEKRNTVEDAVAGTCEVCEARKAKHRCIRCGKKACLTCYWIMLGICKECVTEEKMKELKEHYF